MKFEIFFRLFFTILSVASVSAYRAYNRSISNIVGDFNHPYVGEVSREVELIYSFGVPDNFDPLVISF